MDELGCQTMKHFRLRTIAAFTMALGVGLAATVAFLFSLLLG